MSRTRLLLLLLLPLAALAPAPEARAQAARPPPYSVPWQLRPTTAATALRLDTSYATFDPPGPLETGPTVAAFLLGSWAASAKLAPLLRLGWVTTRVGDDSGSALLNPVIGGSFVQPLAPGLRLALFLGLTIPAGTGGDGADPLDRAALAAGILARSAMDNAMFATDYLTVFPGAGISWQRAGLTLQAEATLLQLTRVRGDGVPGLDDARTNFTSGLHAGYFVIPELSLAAELRHQRWLSTPAFVEADDTGALRDNTTAAFGPRAHLKAGSVVLRPGLSYALPLDDPMAASGYGIVQLDVPVVFP